MPPKLDLMSGLYPAAYTPFRTLPSVPTSSFGPAVRAIALAKSPLKHGNWKGTTPVVPNLGWECCSKCFR
jgi:hypothetical protein